MRERNQGELTVATINTLFDGVSVEQRSIQSWVLLHALTFAGRKGCVQKEQRLREGEHPVEQIIRKYQPKILVANEVIQAPWGSETMSLLDNNGYHHRAIGYPPSQKSSLARITVLASRLPGKSVEVPVSNHTGGRFCALQVEESDLLIVGVQASAFYPKIRTQQIREVFAFCRQKIQEGMHVVVAGDFNSELTDDNGIQIPQELLHFTEPSFPHPNLLQKLEESPKVLRKAFQSLLSLSGGQRSLDHILIPSDWTVLSFDREITSSDHLGLVARIDFSST